MNRGDLKIQFRSVKNDNNSALRVIEYRVNPNQDITYKKYMKLLFGLFNITLTRKYSTEWIRPCIYTFWQLTKEFGTCPVYTSEKFHSVMYNLQWFKNKFKTIKEFEDWISLKDQEACKDHKDYLKSIEPDVIY